jgi:hypothetical protein
MIQSARIIFLHTGSESLNTGKVNKSRYTYELINSRATAQSQRSQKHLNAINCIALRGGRFRREGHIRPSQPAP